MISIYCYAAFASLHLLVCTAMPVALHEPCTKDGRRSTTVMHWHRNCEIYQSSFESTKVASVTDWEVCICGQDQRSSPRHPVDRTGESRARSLSASRKSRSFFTILACFFICSVCCAIAARIACVRSV